ncbi:hypothetical protein ACFO26_02210 [Lactococcus nasutitermitis]|uniref:Uncharacterized protein n=1 Tax=Lactococcus nasutitermitis TaxID=1652957 RepID=A0ABV9JB54_9LACT|nr:hypothetical protein [Lactococcus nasutitermitis]
MTKRKVVLTSIILVLLIFLTVPIPRSLGFSSKSLPVTNGGTLTFRGERYHFVTYTVNLKRGSTKWSIGYQNVAWSKGNMLIN